MHRRVAWNNKCPVEYIKREDLRDDTAGEVQGDGSMEISTLHGTYLHFQSVDVGLTLGGFDKFSRIYMPPNFRMGSDLPDISVLAAKFLRVMLSTDLSTTPSTSFRNKIVKYF